MKSLFNIFRKRWLITLLGLIALSLLIWWAGPLFAFGRYKPLDPEWTRWLCIAALFGVWILRMLIKWARDLRNNSNLLSALSRSSAKAPASPTEQAAADELGELKKGLEHALTILKKSGVKGRLGHQHLYQLPWYMIIGKPGGGKTTLLLKSGLQFPLAERLGAQQVKIKGVGGTRNCDWWFTDEAVLLDTAGRYTTQDSDRDVDKAAWSGFLQLLKKYRRRRPINGALVAVSISDLLRETPSERSRHAHDIRQRLDELSDSLGIKFPIYVMFTKCDLLAGFVDFFADCGGDERAQVWGMTLPMHSGAAPTDVAELFRAEFDVLEQRLNSRVIDRVQQERDSQRRALIYSFPQQFSALREILAPFLGDLFGATRYEALPLLRGVYFTSGTQEGTPIDRIMAAMANAIGLDQSPIPANMASGKSYFINRLLRDVIFKESGLAGLNMRYERQQIWLLRGAYVGIATLALFAVLAWSVSYGRNKLHIGNVGAQAGQLKAVLSSIEGGEYTPSQVLPLMDAARGLPGGYAEREQATRWGMGFGLSQVDKLGEEETRAYYRVLNQVFLPGLVRRLEDHLRQRSSAGQDDLFEALRTYLMLNGQHFDPESVQAWLTHDLDRSAADIPGPERARLAQHTMALFETPELRPPPLLLDAALVQDVRQTLLQAPVAERLYSQLKSDPTAARLSPFAPADVGPDATNVLRRLSGKSLTTGIPGLFTYDGYAYFKANLVNAAAQATKDSWVLGDDAKFDAARTVQITEDMRSFYYKEYIARWDELLGDVVPKTGPSLEQMANTLRDLARPDSPWKKFLVKVAEQTRLHGPPPVADKPGVVEKLVGQSGKKVMDFIGETKDRIADETDTPVDRHYAYLHQSIFAGPAGEPAPIIDVQAALADAQAQVRGLAEKQKKGDPVTRSEINQATDKLKAQASRLGGAVGKTLSAMAADIEGSGRVFEYHRVDGELQTKIVAYCAKAIRGRYPIERSGAQEVPPLDFGKFFGPNGVMDTFYQTELKTIVDTTHGAWRNKPDSGLSVSHNTLAAFQNASVIRDVFFRSGGQSLELSFELTPLTMDPRITQFILDIDGQIATYSHGPTRTFGFKWPVPNGQGRVRMQITPPLPSGTSGASLSGPWALFRMLDKMEFQPFPQQPERYKVIFSIEGRSATFELKASSVYNPFRLQELKEFQCPQRL